MWNEEANIAACLASVAWADQVIVVDSHSRDRTAEIARDLGAEVLQFDYTGSWPKKKNWALTHAPIRHQWVLLIDADERVSAELAIELANLVTGDPIPYDGFFVNRRLIFLGRWIRHCGWYPSWAVRLVRRGRGQFERLQDSEPAGSGDVEVHEHVVTDGPIGYLRHDVIHEDFKSISHFLDRHNRYSTWEAALQVRAAANGHQVRANLFGTPLERKRWLKQTSLKLPLRPLVKFVWMYLVKRGVLDGRPGFIFCSLMAFHEAAIDAKVYELRLQSTDSSSSTAQSEVTPCAASPAS